MIKLILALVLSATSAAALAQSVPCPAGLEAYCAQRSYESASNNLKVNSARKMLEISTASYERNPDAAHKVMMDEDQMRLNAAISRQ